MAKKCMVERNKRRGKLAARYSKRREELSAIVKSQDASFEDKMQAQVALQKLPRDSSATRFRNRCVITGRPRGNFRRFNLSRIKLLECFYLGFLPGLRKSSW